MKQFSKEKTNKQTKQNKRKTEQSKTKHGYNQVPKKLTT